MPGPIPLCAECHSESDAQSFSPRAQFSSPFRAFFFFVQAILSFRRKRIFGNRLFSVGNCIFGKNIGQNLYISSKSRSCNCILSEKQIKVYPRPRPRPAPPGPRARGRIGPVHLSDWAPRTKGPDTIDTCINRIFREISAEF